MDRAERGTWLAAWRIIRRRWVRRAAISLALLVVGVGGACLGLVLGGSSHQDVGPFSARFSITPALHGGTTVEIPPLGSLDLRSHQAPVRLTIRLESLDQARTLALATDRNGLTAAGQQAVSDVERGVIRLALQSAGAAILGAMALGALLFRRMNRVAICGAMATVAVLASGAAALLTFRPSSVEEPRFNGLLAKAPAVVGDARRISGQFNQYQLELQRLVTNMTRLYSTFSNLPVYEPDPTTIRVLHVSDLHLNPSAWSVIQTVVQQFDINLVIDTGDIDDWGTPIETSFVAPIGNLKVPYVYIRGNHDSAVTAAAVAREPNAIVLEDQVTVVDGLTIAGIGDPRFTPDKSTRTPDASTQSILTASGNQLASTIRSYGKPVDIALVHDPASAEPMVATVPLVLAGHLHHREIHTLSEPPGGTLLMVEGSTGGAGLRGLEGEKPTPLEMSVLYFDQQQHKLRAHDDITIGGAGQTEVSLERHLVNEPAVPGASPSPSPS
ncbi:MAG: metallophosphoesterase [Micromonosporaceae bacterium]|nr:metallophosphoesterase [Micromonosporaceae bacterium]